ncbi:MFS transporter [Alkalicoccobacillus murimartini]|uniref:MFS family permease n=1 Tax=Alkalicoccobacillus murimartini TaxID=171685 RepID=A0ABT9YLP5_9BACI|nr:MFS transporter [Alkalicoccobacillus murimartini]MDQ0208661.1 MFS family permease [Alkalicoccobacillus murimartini]
MKWNKNFSLLLTGQSMANIGDVLYIVSIISVIFDLTGSATAASFVPFTITTSMFVSSLLTPLLIGKVNLKWLLACSQIAKTIILVILGFSFTHVTSSNYYIIYLIIGSIAFFDGCANPIMRTLIPHYVDSERLIHANGISETVIQTIQTIMWFFGSLFLILLSAQEIIWIVGCIFTVSSIILCFLENVRHQTLNARRKLEQIQEGWKTLLNTPVLKKIAIIDVFETMAGTVWIAAILLVFVNDALHADEKWWGFINGSFFLGLIIGSIYCIKYASFIEKRLGTLILFSSVASFIITILFSLNSLPIVALLLSLCVGLFAQLKGVPQQTIIQTSVSKEQLATVYTSLGAIGTGIFGVGSLLMGMVADLFGIRVVFLISGLFLCVSSFIVYRNKDLFDGRVKEELKI